MNKKAILYVRVSTDEQNNGYSPADQKARLEKYCENNKIDIVKIYHEDESAKDFNRPEWKKIITYLKKNRGVVDLMLFIKWDRFSRNAEEAYIAIKELRKYGIEPQAIEQPLNLEIPEQKLMLALYLVAPEVDNDRRSLNIFHGMRRGKKEGRWLGTRLRGYKNARDENNRPVMIPEGGETEELVKQSFVDFATGNYNIEELRRIMNKKGLKVTRNTFWVMLRNRAYLGQVYVPRYKDEAGEWIKAKHKPLISDEIFYDVQDILEGRKKKVQTKNITANNDLPLRGYLMCPICSKNLTGSASRGRSGGRFYYYHCTKGCKERKPAKIVNETFQKVLGDITISEEYKELFTLTLMEKLNVNNKNKKAQIIILEKELERNEQRLKNARSLMLDGEINIHDYKQMKFEIDEKIKSINIEMAKSQKVDENGDKIKFAVSLLSNIDRYYNMADIQVKQKIIGSIFPEKLIFENNKCRTAKINEVVGLICSDSNGFGVGKKRKHTISDMLSCSVVPPGIEPGTQGFSVLCSTD
jgi:site-specific DNA recombinase